jgi:hypothetical protein
MDTESIVSYLVYRKWRSSLFFNIALLLLAALIAQVATNFLSGKPGMGGLRVSLHTTLLTYIFS